MDHQTRGPDFAFSASRAPATLLAFDPAERNVLAPLIDATACACADLTDEPDPSAQYDVIILHIGSNSEQVRQAVEAWRRYADDRGATIVCSTSLDQLDSLTDLIPDDEIFWLVDFRPDEWFLTLMAAHASRRQGSATGLLRDQGTEAEVALARITDELERMGRMLSGLARSVDAAAPPGLAQTPVGYRPQPDRRAAAPLDAPRLRRMLAERRARARFFDEQLFGEPCWDMLLDLMAARLEEKRVSVSSLCIAAAVPPTTALRWMKAMTEMGLIERVADPKDGRRVFVRISDKAAAALNDWNATVGGQAG